MQVYLGSVSNCSNENALSGVLYVQELLMTKQRLEDERLHQEAAIDKLKCCLKLFW
jgi:hypothetical protein